MQFHLKNNLQIQKQKQQEENENEKHKQVTEHEILFISRIKCQQPFATQKSI